MKHELKLPSATRIHVSLAYAFDTTIVSARSCVPAFVVGGSLRPLLSCSSLTRINSFVDLAMALKDVAVDKRSLLSHHKRCILFSLAVSYVAGDHVCNSHVDTTTQSR